MKIFLIYIIVINIISFLAMYSDKQKSMKKKWRTPEKVLFLYVFLGGGIGGTIAMHLFHHKTKHWYFKYGFPIITIIEFIAVVYVINFINK